jgi:hypothetical protein
MGVTHNKATVISNRDSTPQVISNGHLAGGALKGFAGVVEVLTTDSVGSTYRFGRVPSNARVSQLLASCDDSGTTGTMDFGVYKTTKDGGAVVDADFFSAAKSLNAAALKNSDVTHDNTSGFGVEKIEMQLWQALGLTADPCIDYDIVGTLTEVVVSQATVALKGSYAT